MGQSKYGSEEKKDEKDDKDENVDEKKDEDEEEVLIHACPTVTMGFAWLPKGCKNARFRDPE